MSGRTVHLVCNAHLDPVWLWDWEEGAAEALSTFRAAARLCAEFPEFVFNHNEAVLYRWVEKLEPRLFSLLKALAAEARWHIMGGWHLQPDCNMPSGESFIRQVMLGRRYFSDRFGTAAKTAANLDSFGHSRGLVQILAKSGYDSYLFCRPDPAAFPLPEEAFLWVGFDGSQILARRATAHYNSRGGQARKKLESWLRARPAEHPTILLWGVGNHGGGPSRRDLLDLRQSTSDHPDIRVVHSTPENYFGDLSRERPALPRVEESLNPWAVGCYTSLARVKHKHRLLENGLFSAEKMAAAAFVQGLLPYPAAELAEAQADLAFSQFHDILPGSCAPSVEEGALRLMDHGLEILSRVKAAAFFALAEGQESAAEGEIPILVFNPHPYCVSGVVEAELQPAEPNEKRGLLRPRLFKDGAEIPAQLEKEQSTLSLDWRKRVVFPVKLEPGMMTRFTCRLVRGTGKPRPKIGPAGRPIRVRTAWGEVVINHATGLVDRLRVDERDFLQKNAFQPIVLRDNADPWGMGVRSFRQEAGRFRLMTKAQAAWFCGAESGPAEPVRVVEDGPVRMVVEALLSCGHSWMCQRYKISKLDPQLELEVRVMWNEKSRMLKLRIPTGWVEAACLGQVVYGVEELRANGDESVSQKWAAIVSRNRSLALTVINDRTYGSDFHRGELRLSLLRSPAYAADPEAAEAKRFQGRFIPRQDQGEHLFRFWIQGGEAEARLASVDREALARNEAPYVLSFFPPGNGAKPMAAAVLDDDAVQMTAMKKAEDGDGLILRLFEPTGRPRTTTVSLPWAGVQRTVRLRPFEVKTLRFDRTAGRFEEVDLMERPAAGTPAAGPDKD